MANQITMSFTGYDDNDDGVISFEGPIYVSAQVDNVSDLLTLDISTWNKEDPLVVFVKNVNSEAGETAHRGSFFKYDFDTSGWLQIMLGSHSHANMELLNQLGDIDVYELEPGKKKILTIEAIPTENYNVRVANTSDGTYVQWCRASDDDSVDNNWRSIFKLNKVYQTNVFNKNEAFIYNLDGYTYIHYNSGAETEVIGNDGNKLEYNSKLTFTVDDGVFNIHLVDGGTVNADIASEVRIYKNRVQWRWKYNDYWTDIMGLSSIVDADTNTSAKFRQIGYRFSYAEPEELGITNSTVNDNESSVDHTLYAPANHAHSQYIKWSDADAFDYRYADYQHTHSQYITKAQVVALLSDIIEETEGPYFVKTADQTYVPGKKYYRYDGKVYAEVSLGDMQVDALGNPIMTGYYEKKNIFDEIFKYNETTGQNELSGRLGVLITQLTEQINNVANSTMTKEQIHAELANLIKAHNDTDEIKVATDTEGLALGFSNGSTTLTDYLIYLTNKTNTVSQLDATKVTTNEIKVNKDVGGYKAGDVINKGTSLETVVENLLAPTELNLQKPTLTVDITMSNREFGKPSIITIDPHYEKNDGANATIKIYVYKDARSNTGATEYTYIGNPINYIMGELSANASDGNVGKIVVVATYKEGPHTVIGNNEYFVNAGSISYSEILYGVRLPYIGTSNYSFNTVTGQKLMEMYDTQINNLLFEFDVDKNPLALTAGHRITATPDTDTLTVIAAIPEAYDYDIAKLIYENQGFDLLEDCKVYKNVVVPDSSGNISSFFNYDYTIYVYSFRRRIQSNVGLTFMFTPKEEE